MCIGKNTPVCLLLDIESVLEKPDYILRQFGKVDVAMFERDCDIWVMAALAAEGVLDVADEIVLQRVAEGDQASKADVPAVKDVVQGGTRAIYVTREA